MNSKESKKDKQWNDLKVVLESEFLERKKIEIIEDTVLDKLNEKK